MDGNLRRPDSEQINSNNYTIKTVENVFSAFPKKKEPKGKKKTEEEKAKEAEEEALI